MVDQVHVAQKAMGWWIYLHLVECIPGTKQALGQRVGWGKQIT